MRHPFPIGQSRYNPLNPGKRGNLAKPPEPSLPTVVPIPKGEETYGMGKNNQRNDQQLYGALAMVFPIFFNHGQQRPRQRPQTQTSKSPFTTKESPLWLLSQEHPSLTLFSEQP